MLSKTLLFASAIFLSLKCYGVNVQGVALLSDASDHTGITVSFIPKSVSAVATSTLSLPNGSFTLSVVPGVYDIKYTKDGYQEVLLIDQFINSNATIDQAILSSKPVVHVTGNVSGNWVNTNMYFVDGDITVQGGTELVIQEGTTVKFTGFYGLRVLGKLTAIGSKGKEIVLTSNKTSKARGDWAGITVATPADTTRFIYCQIEYAASKPSETAIIGNTGKLVVKNSVIRGSAYGGLYNQNGGYLKLENTEVTDVYFYGVVSTSSAAGAVINNNKIHHIDLIGLSCQWSVSQAIGNWVYNTGYHGIQAYGDFLIERNLLFNNPYGVFVVSGKPVIRNNTIYKNGHGIGFYDSDYWHPTAIISSNIIFQNNGYGIYCEGIYKPEKVEYNLIYGNPNGIANRGPVGLGTVLTTNVNGHQADAHMNIFQNPGLFSVDVLNENYFYLLPTSAAIDAGDPLLKDSDNSTVDAGAISFQKYNQSITFGELIEKTFGDADFTVTATSSAALPVTFYSDNTNVAIVESNTVKIVGAGSAHIIAKAGNTNYKSVELPRELIVHKADQSITFDELTEKTFGDADFTVTATSSASLPITFYSDNTKVAVVENNTVKIIGAGSVHIIAKQVGNINYKLAELPRELVVLKADQSILFPIPASLTLGESPFALNATASSKLAIDYVANNDRVSISSGLVTLVSAGRVSISATQSGNENYEEASSVERSFCIFPAKPIITLESMNYNKPILTSSNTNGNQWFFNGTEIPDATTKSWEATADGLYTVVSKIDDCQGKISESYAVIITGVEPEAEDAIVETYPNPVQEALVIKVKGEMQCEVKFILRNSLGQVLLESSCLVNVEKRVDLGGIKSGIYFLQLQTNHGLITKQIMKR